MPAPRLCLGLLALALLPACDHRPPNTGATHPTVNGGTAVPTATVTTASAPTSTTTTAQTVGHVRVSIKKVSVGKVPLKAADGSLTYSDESRLMIALRIQNVSDKQQSGYNTWVPDLDAARTVATLTNDLGNDLKRITFGFGNNVQGRTVLDTLTPGKVIGDLLVFEAPAANVRALKLVLPGANCGVKGKFDFEFDAATIIRPK
jgi:hypothetical protein